MIKQRNIINIEERGNIRLKHTNITFNPHRTSLQYACPVTIYPFVPEVHKWKKRLAQKNRNSSAISKRLF